MQRAPRLLNGVLAGTHQHGHARGRVRRRSCTVKAERPWELVGPKGGASPSFTTPVTLQHPLIQPDDVSEGISVPEKLRRSVIDDGRDRRVGGCAGAKIAIREFNASQDGRAQSGKESGADGMNRHALNGLACAEPPAGTDTVVSGSTNI